LILLLSFFASLWIPAFQTAYVRYGLSYFTDRVGARIDVQHVNIRLNGSVTLQGVLVLDQKNDTLLFAEKLQTKVGSWIGLQEQPHFKTTQLSNALIRVKEISESGQHNFDFLVDALSTPTKKPTGKEVPILLGKIKGTNIRLEYHRFRGNNNGPLLNQKDFTLANTQFSAENWSIGKTVKGTFSQVSTEINATEKIRSGYLELLLDSTQLQVKKLHLRTSTAIAKGNIQVKGKGKNQRIAIQLDSLYIQNRALQKWAKVEVPFQRNALVKGKFVLENQTASAKKIPAGIGWENSHFWKLFGEKLGRLEQPSDGCKRS